MERGERRATCRTDQYEDAYARGSRLGLFSADERLEIGVEDGGGTEEEEALDRLHSVPVGELTQPQLDIPRPDGGGADVPAEYGPHRRVLAHEGCDELECSEDDAQQEDDEQRRQEGGECAVELGVDEELPDEVDGEDGPHDGERDTRETPSALDQVFHQEACSRVEPS